MIGVARTVLFLSDEAVSVYTVVGGRYDMVGEVQWQDPELIGTLSDMLKKQGKGRPIMMLYDMVEQYYRKEIVPKVAMLDQQNVLNRKLAASFPNYSMRASLPLKVEKTKVRKSQNEKTAGLDGKPYLFAALPETDQMSRLTEAAREAMVGAAGIFLLPIESVSMVQQLSTKLNRGLGGPGRWTIYLSQHRGGGLRQIVIRDGELALTRLTPVVDTDIEPHLWATEVAQEFNATMGYLSRFGYTQGSELEVIAVGGLQALQNLEDQIKVPSFFPLTVPMAAKALGLNVHADDNLRHGDILNVGWLAKKLRFTLPFKSRELAFISKVRLGGLVASRLLLLASLGAIGYGASQVMDIMSMKDELETKQHRLVQLEEEYQAELKRKEEYNIDIKLVQGSIAIHDKLEKNKIDMVTFLQKIAFSLKNDLHFDAINMSFVVEQQQNPDQMAVGTIEKKHFETVLTLGFPGTFKPEMGNKLVSDLRDRIAQNLPDYDVTVSQAVKDLTYNSSFKFETGQKVTQDSGSLQKLTATITIRQRQNDQTPGP